MTTNIKRLQEREKATGAPVRVGLVGAGQMGRGFIAQIARIPGLHMSAVADIALDRAVDALRHAGIDAPLAEGDLAAAILAGQSVVVNDGIALTELPVDIIVEVSGVPDVAASVAYAALLKGKDVALMTVEADVTVGLLLAETARATGAIYTVCRGDEPAECLKLIEYALDLGLEVVTAGKGKNNPLRPTDTPDDLVEEAKAKHMNPKMLCSFVDGTKTMIEMAALCNATGLKVSQPGFVGPASSVATLAADMIPVADGGALPAAGVVDYCTGDVAPGVFVIAKSTHDVVTEELDYLRLGTGPFYSLYRPYHLASVEAPLSIFEAVLDREASFAPISWTAEVTAVAKRDLKAGEKIDGIGGSMVHGFTMSAEDAAAEHALPIGLTGGTVLTRDVAAGSRVSFDDVQLDPVRPIVALRRLQAAMLRSGALPQRGLESL
ncbi:oxidoreductase [Micrococcales bacterium 31B]|nr:oxidoreductase [Micrococcales bacterium 31B]